ncbi:54S ribosomal protein L8 [Penicillium argentinense]|uniref:Large ribosomal subunit protein bL17m n=1 Tax=Penicillium argentinense TaxID=1131581 RepID=A0A9W9G586_9EURO|nr:54S ribosomal protein L8 [Penicillium argentinense]KAJ5112236.1 54S ribosomal protein L8 [Penicillium argentinense]
MAGGGGKYRHLGRKSSHRQALLRNLVTSLFENESITTTWHKAKEAQRLADKLITLGKKNSEASRRRALEIFYKPHSIIPKLFGPLRERYADRPGGYTRVLRIEPKQKYEYYSAPKGDKNAVPERKPHDQAPSAILELVDGPKDMRFAMTARTVARQREFLGNGLNELTELNVRKVTRFRKGGLEALEEAVRNLKIGKDEGVKEALTDSEAKAAEEEASQSVEEEAKRSEEQAARLTKRLEALKR